MPKFLALVLLLSVFSGGAALGQAERTGTPGSASEVRPEGKTVAKSSPTKYLWNNEVTYYDWGSSFDAGRYYQQPQVAKAAFASLLTQDMRELVLYKALADNEVCGHYKIECGGLKQGQIEALFAAAIEEQRRGADHALSRWSAFLGFLGGVFGGILGGGGIATVFRYLARGTWKKMDPPQAQ